jgi:hypothetical protein
MGWLQPGQGTVFPNALSVIFKGFMQWGQFILNNIGFLPSSYPRPNTSSEWFVVQTGGITNYVYAQPFCCEISD